MLIRLTDEQLGQKLCDILNDHQSPRRNEQGMVIQEDEQGVKHVAFFTDKFFDLPAAAREFAELVQRMSVKPRRKKKAAPR